MNDLLDRAIAHPVSKKMAEGNSSLLSSEGEMSDDIQKETERIHQGIVESLSFSDALAKRDAEIERLAKELESADRIANDWARQNGELRAEIERLRAYVAEVGRPVDRPGIGL